MSERAELGDATEVYDVTLEPDTVFSFESPIFAMRSPDGESGEVFVDEVHAGRIALLTTVDFEAAECSAIAQLDAAQARRLANTLHRAADYAEDQGGRDE